jgi:hypothetical protein
MGITELIWKALDADASEQRSATARRSASSL